MNVTIKASDYPDGKIPKDVTDRISKSRFRGLCTLQDGGIEIDSVSIIVRDLEVRDYIIGKNIDTPPTLRL